MKILLANDDGIEAKGIQVLAARLEKDGHDIHEHSFSCMSFVFCSR